MAALSDVDICNLAQQKLGASDPIGSIVSPQGTAARAYAILYPHYRDVELRGRRWRFALAEDHPVPLLAGRTTDDEYPYRYSLPENSLRVIRDKLDRYKQVGQELWSQTGAATLKIDYIRSDIESGYFDPNFVEVLACRLAYERCEKATQSNTKKQELRAMWKEAITVAGQMNAFITGPETYGEDDGQYSWITERYL